MRFGLIPSIVVQLPGASDPWEADGSGDDLVRIAEAADTLGFHHITCSEHTVVPVDIAAVRGGTYWDPLATLSFLAARTRRIRLATNVLVLGYHHPLELVKRYGTLDRLSGGRVLLGLGVGTLEQEFDLLGAEFTDRGPRADDALRALRASWGRPEPSYDGPYYSFRDLLVEPHAPRTDVPLWIGGRTRRSLRRAVELGNGWMPFGLSGAEITQMLATFDLPQDFDVILQTPRLDPLGDPDRTRSHIAAAAEAGASMANVSVSGTSRTQVLDQLHALSELYPEAMEEP
ncbi:LLM class F420-dependent oxidoreductase [Actinokineospora sp. NBRC 105648]|uniref:LLM class F420-dependent oxidoreductase n=1 Tax=Actinokineospora sp. NBRC 105648 TaxID=3032206 RepID=UPI0024A59DF3|nr:LLM class F420-dependent oxidoreductase [Actinokineospora sp. NBRC 105648]GLZ41992.1 LLM class F420-dependent oxidoreductase [Actinokineospora sp. NBRC 105648]